MLRQTPTPQFSQILLLAQETTRQIAETPPFCVQTGIILSCGLLLEEKIHFCCKNLVKLAKWRSKAMLQKKRVHTSDLTDLWPLGPGIFYVLLWGAPKGAAT